MIMLPDWTDSSFQNHHFVLESDYKVYGDEGRVGMELRWGESGQCMMTLTATCEENLGVVGVRGGGVCSLAGLRLVRSRSC